jgi:hypothetical protein
MRKVPFSLIRVGVEASDEVILSLAMLAEAA